MGLFDGDSSDILVSFNVKISPLSTAVVTLISFGSI